MKLVKGAKYMRVGGSKVILPYNERAAAQNSKLVVFTYEGDGKKDNGAGKETGEGRVGASVGSAEGARVQPVDDLGTPVVLEGRRSKPVQLSS